MIDVVGGRRASSPKTDCFLLLLFMSILSFIIIFFLIYSYVHTLFGPSPSLAPRPVSVLSIFTCTFFGLFVCVCVETGSFYVAQAAQPPKC
jgi:hypothetical protein